MEIRFIAQSCFYIEKNNTVIITDPWSGKNKAFYNSWVPFPYNDARYLLKNNLSDKSVYIFLSHEHSDHFDIEMLKKLYDKNKNIKFLLPNFNQYCFDKIKNIFYKNKIFFLNDNETININKFKFKLVFEQPLFNEHSACIIEDDKQIFINSNDSVIDDFSIKNRNNKVIIYTGQFSSVSPYPSNSLLIKKSLKEKLENAHLNLQIDNFCNGVNKTDSNIAIPSSGPAVCIPNKKKVNQMRLKIAKSKGAFDNTFIKKQMQKKINSKCKVFFLKPNEQLKKHKNGVLTYKNKFDSKKERIKNFNNLLKFYNFKIDLNKKKKFKTRQILNKFSTKFIKIYSQLEVNKNLIFDLVISDDKKFSRFDFSTNKPNFRISSFSNLKLISKNLKKPYYSVNINFNHLEDLAERSKPFEEFWYGGHVSIIEKNKGYNANILNVLNVMHSTHLTNLLITHSKKEECFEVNFNKKKYLVKRYCPHRGADLINCKPDEKGIITCPAHGWKISIF